MKKRTLRGLLKASIPVNALFFTAALLDFLYWESRAMVAILAAYAVLLVGIFILLLLEETPAFRRLRLHEGQRGPKTIIYGRR